MVVGEPVKSSSKDVCGAPCFGSTALAMNGQLCTSQVFDGAPVNVHRQPLDETQVKLNSP